MSLFKILSLLFIFIITLTITSCKKGHYDLAENKNEKTVTMSDRSGNLVIRLNYSDGCIIDLIRVNGTQVTDSSCPVFTGIEAIGQSWTSMKCASEPVVSVKGNSVTIDPVVYGPENFRVTEKWVFRLSDDKINWRILRNYAGEDVIDDNCFPCWQFRSMQTWDGAILDNGGVAWNRFLSEKGESYGTHTDAITLWNKSDNRCLKIIPSDEEGFSRVVTFRHQQDDRFAVVQSLSADKIMTRYGLFRFLNDEKKVFSPFRVSKSFINAEYTISSAWYDQEYDRGDLKGVNADAINEMFNTIGRYGVVDRDLYGSNGWRTGWVVLQEPWLALYGLANNFPEFISGFSKALEYAAGEAVMPDGRVLPRWHHDSTDAMPGTWLENGFYECKWGYMLDTQPAFAINVAEQFDITGDTSWLKKLSPVCERAIDYMIKRDADNDGLFEVVQQSYRAEKGTDWLDVIWASHEVSTINAFMYMALTRWSELEGILGNDELSRIYGSLALKLKTSYNKDITEGGFWDPGHNCYVHWREKDGRVYGNNMNSVVNFLSIGYGLCDNKDRIRLVLDHIEELMQKEKLFVWPSCFFRYDLNLGLSVNYPFPNYENGDLFLAWAELGTRCYAGYNPEIALKYVRNVIDQYEKDGLSHQRYTRVKQTGAGDDILSNNIMAVVGLYRNLYGIRPKYNRLYLEPHLTPELNGTKLNYLLRGREYSIALSEGKYTIGVENYSISENRPFAVNYSGSGLEYFSGSADKPSLKLSGEGKCSVDIVEWSGENKVWKVAAADHRMKINYELPDMESGREYMIDFNGKRVRKMKADPEGIIRFANPAGKKGVQIRIIPV